MSTLISASYLPESNAITPACFVKTGIDRFDPLSEYEQEMHTTPVLTNTLALMALLSGR